MMGWASFSFFQRQENGFPPWFFVVFHAGELLVLKTALRVSNSHRCQILSRMLDLKGNIRVFCRVRPLLSNERNARVGHLTTTPGTDTITVVSCRKDFQFDKVFLPSSVQGEFTI
jgi:hypothetical protein